MTSRVFLAVAMILSACSVTRAAEARKPNIIFILADDLGWADVGCYGADLHETPNLDHLATQGVRFTQAYAMPVCSPTRASIMTGKHAARLHITIWREGAFDKPDLKQKLIPPQIEPNLQLTDISVAKALKSAGYLTFHVGKWHLGDGQHYPERTALTSISAARNGVRPTLTSIRTPAPRTMATSAMFPAWESVSRETISPIDSPMRH